MFGTLGFTEIIFILALALLIFGPRKLPEIGRTIGRGLAEFRKASTDLKRTINAEMIEEELRESDPRKILKDNDPRKIVKDAVSGTSVSEAGDAEEAGDEKRREDEPLPGSPMPDVVAESDDSAIESDTATATEADSESDPAPIGTVARGTSVTPGDTTADATSDAETSAERQTS